jgi:hypothetical protein
LPCCCWRRLVAGHPYRRIPLTQGQFALVDPEDYAELAKHKWCASRQSNTFYAVRGENGRQIRMHRVVLTAAGPVDHINHDGRDNTAATSARTKAENACNRARSKAVALHRRRRPKGTNKWYARIHAHGTNLARHVRRRVPPARDAAAIAIYGPYIT